MNWDAIAAVGEIVGAIAVIVTVAYLALQIRQNTAALRSTATQGASDQIAGLYHTMCTDPDLAMIVVRGTNTPDELSESEMARYFSVLMMAMFNMQNWYLQTQDRFMDETILSSWSKVLESMSATPGYQLFWENRCYVFSPKFRQYLETEVFAKEPDPNYTPLGVVKKQGS